MPRTPSSDKDSDTGQSNRKEPLISSEVLMNAPIGIFTSSPEGRIISANQTMARMLGYETPDELIASITDLGKDAYANPDDRVKMKSLVKEHGKTHEYQCQWVNRSGDLFWVSIHARAVWDAKGKLYFYQGFISDITGQKQAEKELHKTNAIFEEAGQMTKVGGWELDADTMEVKWTEQTCRIHEVPVDYKPSSLEEAVNFFHPEDREKLRQGIQRALVQGEPYDMELRFITAKGNHLWTRATCRPQVENGKASKLFGAFQDITDYKQTEQSLQQEKNFLKQIMETSPVCITFVDREGKISLANSAAEETLGLKRHDIYNRGYDDPAWRITDFEGNDYPKESLPFYLVKKSGTAVYGVEHAIEWPNGKRVLLSINSAPIFDSKGDFNGMISVIENVTERKQAEEERKNLQAQLSNALEMARLAHWEYDVTNDLFTFNDHFYNIFGTTAGKEGGYKMSSAEYARRFVHPDDAHIVEQEVQKAIKTTDPNFSRQLEHRIFYSDGTIGHISVQFFAVGDVHGNAVRTYGVNQDITEYKRAEKNLQESKARLTSLVDNLFEALIVTDNEGVLQFVNPAASNLFGREKDQLAGVQFGFPVTLGEMFEVKINTPGGEIRHAEARATVTDWGGKEAYLITLRDVTERKLASMEREEMDARLQQLQRIESIGTLAGGIAHDFNNILSPIIGFTELAMDQVEENSIAKESLHQVYQAATRAKDLVKQILAFSRQAESEFQPVLLPPIVKEILKMLRSTLPSTIEIRENITSKRIIMGDPTSIHQILMNLCTNAKHAMGESGGVLSVSLEDIDISYDYAKTIPEFQKGRYVRLRVKDTGPGIDTSIIDKIFEPYFTTKEEGEGTGLGLSVAHGIIKSHGGAITLESKPGKGSTFDVYFPVSERTEEEKQVTARQPPKGNEHILLVDDEPPIVQLNKQLLEKLGYRVSARTSSLEALELFKNKPDTFDMLLTDMTMPHMAGDKLSLECTRIRPALPVILVTGFSERLNQRKARDMGINAFLYKPISKVDLGETIRKVLDGNQQQEAKG